MRSLGIDIGGTAVKAALVQDGAVISTGCSEAYTRPDQAGLERAVLAALAQLSTNNVGADVIGMCVPGVVDGVTGLITNSVNLPGIVGIDPASLVGRFGKNRIASLQLFSDGRAAAHDVWNGAPGRLAAVSIGTGVGLCVLDDGSPLEVVGQSPGHLGQMDVSLDAAAPVGPDGGRGGLEAYIGWPALRARLGPDAMELVSALDRDDAPLRALARALRIVHAIYRPDRIVLLGGVGIALAPRLEQLRALVSDQLTSLARDGWTLETGTTQHHAAIGAAKLAAEMGSSAHS